MEKPDHAATALPYEEVVRLAHRLILDREPESEEALRRLAEGAPTIAQLRTQLFLHYDTLRTFDILRFLEIMYRFDEVERNYRRNMDQFLDVGAEREALIRSTISRRSGEYTEFHRNRYFDQLRVLAATKGKIFPGIDHINLLDIGVMSISAMYSEIDKDIELSTCDHPRRSLSEIPGTTQGFYPADLERDELSKKYPELVGKFHLIFFCEVLEHLKVAPAEILSDLKKLLAPGGLIYLTTTNGRGYGVFLAYLDGLSPVSRYSRQNRVQHEENYIHVREYTIRELVTAVEYCGLTVKHRAIKEYFQPNNLIPTRFVGAGSLLTLLIGGP